MALTRDYKRTRGRFYGCGYYHKRGLAVCQNSLLIAQDKLDQVVLQAISEALDERLLAGAVEKALDTLKGAQERRSDRRRAIEQEWALLDSNIRNLSDAIKRGRATDALLQLFEDEHARKKALAAELASFDDAVKIASLDRQRLHQEIVARAADINGLLRRNIPQARQILRSSS